MKRALTAGIALLALSLPLDASAGRTTASSELRDDDGTRGASAAFDGLLQSGWAEGELGNGEGSWIELRFDQRTDVRSISVWPGDLSNGKRSLREHGRPKRITVILDTAEGEVTREVRLNDPAERGPFRQDIPIEGSATGVKIVVDEAYGGFLRNDTYIAEVAVNFAAGEAPAAVERFRTWLTSSGAERAAAQDREQVVALFDAIAAEQFGDLEKLHQIMDRAGDGAPFARREVTRQVPAGYRIQALPPDEVALEAILKLKDPNAIPALERAALRSTGAVERELIARVEMFYAYEDLLGGPNRNLPLWGSSGWERGALRSFGEPMPVAMDDEDRIYVTDVANHRIQRFRPDGTVDKVIAGGGEPEISNAWFHVGRPWYAAGSPPSDAEGQLKVPVALTLIPGKDSDTIAVLDVTGRVQLFDEAGRYLRGWNVEAEGPISPGVGGEAVLLHSRGRIITIWGNEGIVHTTNGEEVARWTIEDGVPTGALVLKNGKLLFAIRDRLVMYTADGYRLGLVLGDLPEGGYEAWDIALDERGRLWAVTDTGWAYKYKKPGVLDYAVRFATEGIQSPRFVVREDRLFITTNDRILRVDALELKAAAEQAEAGE